MIKYFFKCNKHFFGSVSLLLALIITQHVKVKAQDHGYNWAISIGDWHDDLCKSFIRDNSGNIYMTGSFTGTVDFDPGAGIYSLTSTGVLSRSDIFILKLDAQGKFIWAKQMGGEENDEGISIALDAAGNNIFIAGNFKETADFDPGTATANLISQGDNDVFISKLTSGGNFVWAKQIGGTNNDQCNAHFTDGLGNSYLTGTFQGTVDFNPGTANFDLASQSFNSDMFVLKLDASGNFTWAKQIGGDTYTEVIPKAIQNASGNIYITGSFHHDADFDPGIGTLTLTSAGVTDNDIFILKLDASGNLVWAKQTGAIYEDMGNEITIDNLGNVYSTGVFSGTVDFDPGTGTSTLSSSIYDPEVYITKLDASGNFIWAKHIEHSWVEKQETAIATDGNGNVYCTGSFSETVDFDPGTGTYELTANGDEDIFLVKLTSAGNFTWAKRLGGTGPDFISSIKIDASNNIYLSGNFHSEMDADPGVGTHNLTSEGGSDIFLLKMNPCSPTSSTAVISACESYTWIDGTTYTSSTNTATYKVANARGCDSIITLNLTIRPKPVTSTITGEASPAKNSIKTYSVTNTSGSTYQWIISNGTQQSGGTTNNISVKWANTPGNGSIKVVETNAGCNGDTVTQLITILNFTGVNNQSISKDLNIIVQPNPSEDITYLYLYNQQDKMEGNIRMIDINGKNLWEKTINISSGETTIELSEMKSVNEGLYFLYVTTEKVIQVIKVIKTH